MHRTTYLNRILLSALFMCSFLLTQGQQRQIDSLVQLTQKHTGAQLLNDYFLLAHVNIEVSPAQSILWADKCIQLAQALRRDTILGDAYGLLGQAYFYLDDYPKALFFLEKASEVYEQAGIKSKQPKACNNLGIVYGYTANYQKALEYYHKAIELHLANGDSLAIGSALNNIGVIYEQRLHQYDKALEYYTKALRLAYQRREMDEVATYLNNFGDVYLKQNQAHKAIDYYQRGIEVADSNNLKNILLNGYKGMYLAQKKLDNWPKALHYHELYDGIKDTIFDLNKQSLTEELSEQYQSRAREEKIDLLEQQKRQQTILLVSLSLISLLALGFAWRLHQLKQQKEQINRLIVQQKKELTDSIQYAARIQQAMLSSHEELHVQMGEHFILWQPREAVSGDFFWTAVLGNKILLATVDCTGHGVPGGFMSMLGMAYLGDIVRSNNDLQPAQILDLLRRKVKLALRQTGRVREQKDGMDVSLCLIDRQTKELVFAGAQQSVFVVRGSQQAFLQPDGQAILSPTRYLTDTKHQALQLMGDFQPIGIFARETPFRNTHLQLHPSDALYMYTDGYADQAGGPHANKFGSKRLKEILMQHYQLPMGEQRQVLIAQHDAWKGNRRQIDDILLLGLRIELPTTL